MNKKKCSVCRNVKDLSEFSKDKWNSDGHCSSCKVCVKAYYHKNKEKKSEYGKKYYQKNKGKINDRAELNRDHKKEYNNRYYKLNRDMILAQKKRYFKENKQKIYKKIIERKKIDLQFRIGCNLRTRLWYHLKKGIKHVSILNLIGCSVEDLKIHLESQFAEGMNWHNWSLSGWHIDHINPLVSYDLTKLEDQEKAFYWKNLRPMWGKENQSKGSKIKV